MEQPEQHPLPLPGAASAARGNRFRFRAPRHDQRGFRSRLWGCRPRLLLTPRRHAIVAKAPVWWGVVGGVVARDGIRWGWLDRRGRLLGRAAPRERLRPRGPPWGPRAARYWPPALEAAACQTDTYSMSMFGAQRCAGWVTPQKGRSGRGHGSAKASSRALYGASGAPRACVQQGRVYMWDPSRRAGLPRCTVGDAPRLLGPQVDLPSLHAHVDRTRPWSRL